MLNNGRHKAHSTASELLNTSLPERDDIFRVFGKRLKEERTRRHISQETLAEILGVSVDTIKHIEKGQSAALDIAYRAALALRVSLVSLLPAWERDRDAVIEEIEALLQELKNK